MLKLKRAWEATPLATDVRHTSKNVADLVQEALNQSLIPPRQIGLESTTAAKIRQANQTNRAKSVSELVKEALNQTLLAPQQIGEESTTAARIRQLNQISASKNVAELVEEALNQTLAPPKNTGRASATAARIAEINRISTSKGIDDLVEEALNQTLANPKLSLAQFSKNVKNAIPVIQNMLDTLGTIQTKMAGIKDQIKDMTRHLPYNEFLREMRDKALTGVSEINGLIEQTEFSGNRPLDEEGQDFQIALTDGSYLNVSGESFKLQAAEQDFKTRQGVEAFLAKLKNNMKRLYGYQEMLMQQLNRLETEVRQVEFKLTQDLGIDPNEINIDLAAEIAALASSKAV